MTNGDKIRQMSDDEIVNAFWIIFKHGHRSLLSSPDKDYEKQFREITLRRLKEEATE